MTSPETRGRRVAFLDVDGTVIDHSQRLAPSVVSAVRAARAAGHLVFLCTGRSRAEIPSFVAEIGFDGAITAGGGFIQRGGELVAAHTMTPEAVRGLIAFFAERDVEYTLQAYEGAYPSEGLLSRLEPHFSEYGITPQTGDPLFELMAYRGPAPIDGIAKATFFGSDPRTFAIVRDGLGDAFHVITGTIPYLGEAGGEVSLGGIHKGAAITQLVELLGMDLADSIAIGDSANDIEMLQVAGVGVAMGNADAAIKAIADEVTHRVDDDGVWHAFHRHGMI